ncbi:MAG: ATP-binding protein [Lachnospiraceae bacterium]|nr:ATP-binding protein [Lachnospiraceae bacterium]
MWKRLRKMDIDFIVKMFYSVVLIIAFVITIMICVNSPVQRHFKNMGKNDVWFGDEWYYTGTSQTITTRAKRYLQVQIEEGGVSISKTLDFTPSPEEYLCFRARALDTTVYVNDTLWYQHSYQQKYRSHGKRMYMLHQVQTKGFEKGDVITLVLENMADEGSATIQFLAVGDRYALIRYIMEKSYRSLGVCMVIGLVILLSLIASRSAILVDKTRDVHSLGWLICFLALSVIYLATDCGCMEIFIERTSIVSWFNSLSLIMLPIPLMLFTQCAFFPGQRRYDILVLINFIIVIVSITAFAIFAHSMSSFYSIIHILIALDIGTCILSFLQEKLMPAVEAFLGYGAVICSAVVSIFFYWNNAVYPCSVAFGYGAFVFGVCMLVWVVRSRNEINRMRAEANHVIMERDKIAAEEANEQKSRFLSHMSHEIRTPLNAILGSNELILHETKDTNIRKHAVDIQSAGRTLLALINDVLDFSKIETGKIDIIKSDYRLSSVLSDVVAIIKDRVIKAGLELRLDIDRTIPDLLYGDEVRIKQVILNLMTNAVKYTEKGWVELCVRKQELSTYLDEENILLDIRVSDSGVGIRKEEIPKLFVEFERLDLLKNRSVEGTGLGLNITSRLVELMEGKLNVESEYGKGSSFCVLIPQHVLSNVPIGDYKNQFQTQSDEEESLETMCFPGKKVYVIDDNEMNLEVIASILEMLEIEVDRADGGVVAAAHLDQEKYDLILTDDMMPEMSGTDLMQYLHSNPESVSHSTPIVVLTANAVTGAREEYIKKGFDDFMTKPIDIDVLQKILMKYLK